MANGVCFSVWVARVPASVRRRFELFFAAATTGRSFGLTGPSGMASWVGKSRGRPDSVKKSVGCR